MSNGNFCVLLVSWLLSPVHCSPFTNDQLSIPYDDISHKVLQIQTDDFTMLNLFFMQRLDRHQDTFIRDFDDFTYLVGLTVIIAVMIMLLIFVRRRTNGQSQLSIELIMSIHADFLS